MTDIARYLQTAQLSTPAFVVDSRALTADAADRGSPADSMAMFR